MAVEEERETLKGAPIKRLLGVIGLGSLIAVLGCKTEHETSRPTFLFAQTAQSGSLTPVAGQKGRYLLSLSYPGMVTLYFSDRPTRVSGILTTSQFLTMLQHPDFTKDPPNAALTLHSEGPTHDVVVVELQNARFDAATLSVLYDVTVLQPSDGPPGYRDRADQTVPSTFTYASIFIDNVPAGRVSAALNAANATENAMRSSLHKPSLAADMARQMGGRQANPFGVAAQAKEAGEAGADAQQMAAGADALADAQRTAVAEEKTLEAESEVAPNTVMQNLRGAPWMAATKQINIETAMGPHAAANWRRD